MLRTLARGAAVLACALAPFVPSAAGAQSSPSPSPSPAPRASALPAAAVAGSAAAAAAAAQGAAAKPADYDTFVKSAEKQDGLFTVWRKDGKVYLEIRDDQLDTDYLEHAVPVNGLGGYGFHAGDQLVQDARMVRFHTNGRAVAMIWPHTRFEAPAGSAQETAINESSADSVEAELPVAAENKAGKSRIVDVSALLGDLLDLGNNLNDAVGAEHNPMVAYHLDPARTYFGPSKAFPQNVVIEADQSFASAKADTIDTVPDARFVQIKVAYTFANIMSTPGYVPRLADDRVGYWSEGHAIFDHDRQRETNRFYILRWDLQPSDPTQKLSPAKKPIVFYLDRSIPQEYRGAVRDGVLAWNSAFERIGISNAVQVLDAPDDPSWDPDDIRNSVIRWVTDAPTEFGAEAQIVYDPRTGEIFRGGVLLDSNLGRFSIFSERNLLGSLMMQPNDSTYQMPTESSIKNWNSETEYGQQFLEETAFGATALDLSGQSSKLDAYVYERIKDVAMHEVGHDFGLSHNFIAHNAYSPSDLKSAAFTKAHGVSSSVMDYSPVNIWPRGQSQGTWSAVALGTYDYHVIHWGYGAIGDAKTPDDEVPTLDRWASSTTDPKYAFAGDEDGFYAGGHAIDPRAAPFLLTNKPLDWCATQLDFTKGLIGSLDTRFPRPQQPWQEERRAFLALMANYDRCSATLTHYVGGEYVSRNRIGDPGVRVALTPVSRGEQWKAYSLLSKYLFSDANFNFSPTTLRRLVYQEVIPFPSGYGYDPEARHDVAAVEAVNAMQYRAVASMYAPLVLQRLADMPTKAKAGSTMSLADLFTWSQDAIYGDLSHPHGASSQIHRNLQRYYTRVLVRMAIAPLPGTPYDAQALARVELADLAERVKHAQSGKGVDLQTHAHLAAIANDVERALDAKSVTPVG